MSIYVKISIVRFAIEMSPPVVLQICVIFLIHLQASPDTKNGADGKVSLPNKIIIILLSFALLLRVFGFSAFPFLSHLGWRSVLDPPLCHPRLHLLKQLNSLTSTLEFVTEHKHRFPFIF